MSGPVTFGPDIVSRRPTLHTLRAAATTPITYIIGSKEPLKFDKEPVKFGKGLAKLGPIKIYPRGYT